MARTAAAWPDWPETLPAGVRRGGRATSSRRPTKVSISARLDRNEATSNWIATADLAGAAGASDVVQPDDEAVDLRPHPARYLVALLRGRGGEQTRGSTAMSRSAAREIAIELTTCGTRASIRFEPVADLAESIDAGGGGKNGKGADPEEGEQQPPADAEIPAPEF